jgi:hypothetical protein
MRNRVEKEQVMQRWTPGRLAEIETTGEDRLIRLCEVPDVPWLPPRRGGTKLSVSTVFRWVTAGVRGRKLRYTCVGGVRCTCERWLREFFNTLAADEGMVPGQEVVTEPWVTQKAMEKKAEAALKMLAEEGF